jgi:signal transduction histidine kinase
MNNGGLSWSDPYQDVNGDRLVTCSRPVFRPDGAMDAVVAADVTVSELGRLANEIESGLSGGAFLLDRAGNVISAPSGGEEGLAPGESLLADPEGELGQVARRMISGESGLALVEFRGQQEYVAFAPLTATGWSLGVLISLDQVLALSREHRRALEARFSKMEERIGQLKIQLWSTGAVMVLTLVALFSAGVFVRLTRPIQDVIRDLRVIRRGDLEHRVDVGGAQEFRNLSAAINQMTSHLRRSRQAIEEYSRTLERKVDERTRELAQSNEELEETLQQLRETQSLLVHREKMASLGQLVAGIAHEINNPVNFVSNSVGPMRSALRDLKAELERVRSGEGKAEEADALIEQIAKAIKLIETGATRTKQIVLNLRNFSRLDEADMKLANLHDGLDSSLSLLNYQLKGRIRVSKEYGDIGAVECNPGQINQVFMNILANAAQSIDGQGEIRISTEQHGDEVWVRVQDTGKGIPEENLSRIFEPFFTTKAVGDGTGLGLAITHGIIEQHGGAIEVKSEVGKGTEFIIRLPVSARALHKVANIGD